MDQSEINSNGCHHKLDGNEWRHTYIYTFNLNMNEIGFKTDSSEIVIGENGIGFGWIFTQFEKFK